VLVADDARSVPREPAIGAFSRDRTGVGREIVRLVVAHHEGVDPDDVVVEGEPGVKPRLAAGSALTFNVSDADGRVAVAFGHGFDVGVDIEARARATTDPRRLARRIMAPDEHADVADLDDDAVAEALLRAWTRKEAVLKADGRGLRRDLRAFDARPDIVELDGRRWHCRTSAWEGLVLSVAWSAD